jgi:pectate lyase
MRKRLMTMTACLFATFAAFAQAYEAPVGWATIDGTTTGSGNRNPVVVETAEQLKKVLKGETPRTIYLKGEIRFEQQLMVGDFSNKTIYGLPGSALVNDVHYKQESKEDLQPKEKSGILSIKNCSNIIIRNVTFKGPGAYDVDGRDNLFIANGHHIWVDHCDFQDAIDGNLDISNGSDLITISWCRFRYKIAPWTGGSGGSPDHRFSNLLGSSDNRADTDEGKLRVTYACCWWDEGCVRRMPRVRFGKVHIINCYYCSAAAKDCIGAAYRSNIYAENNVFTKTKYPWKVYATKTGFTDYNITMKGNAGAPDEQKRSGDIDYFIPSEYYQIPTMPAMQVPMVVGNETTGAGATLYIEYNGPQAGN